MLKQIVLNPIPQVETPIALIIFSYLAEVILTGLFVKMYSKSWRLLISVIIVNLFTMPLVWFLFPFIPIDKLASTVIIEIVVIIVEAFAIYIPNRNELTIKTSLLLSIILNLISFIVVPFFLYLNNNSPDINSSWSYIISIITSNY